MTAPYHHPEAANALSIPHLEVKSIRPMGGDIAAAVVHNCDYRTNYHSPCHRPCARQPVFPWTPEDIC